MSYIKGLGYIGCNVADLAAWDKFLSALYGINEFDEPRYDIHRFYLGQSYQWITLEKSSQDSLGYIGWEVDSQDSLEEAIVGFDRLGVTVNRATPELCTQRGVADLIQISGPDGVQTELYCSVGDPPKKSCDVALTLGHVVLAASDRRAVEMWYSTVLGFRLSDHIFWDGVEAAFLRCNPRHHSLAITNPVGDMRGGELGHFMLEVDSIDKVGRTYDVARRLGVPIAFTFGRHSNDGAISFYAYSPSGWLVEYGYGGRQVEDSNWEPSVYNTPSIWGHELQQPPGAVDAKQRY